MTEQTESGSPGLGPLRPSAQSPTQLGSLTKSCAEKEENMQSGNASIHSTVIATRKQQLLLRRAAVAESRSCHLQSALAKTVDRPSQADYAAELCVRWLLLCSVDVQPACSVDLQRVNIRAQVHLVAARSAARSSLLMTTRHLPHCHVSRHQ